MCSGNKCIVSWPYETHAQVSYYIIYEARAKLNNINLKIVETLYLWCSGILLYALFRSERWWSNKFRILIAVMYVCGGPYNLSFLMDDFAFGFFKIQMVIFDKLLSADGHKPISLGELWSRRAFIYVRGLWLRLFFVRCVINCVGVRRIDFVR